MQWRLNKIDIRPNDLRALCSPGVYLFWKDDVALYIGSSKRTIARMADRNHESAQKALRECTRVEIRFTETEQDAREGETFLIMKYKPLYNKTCRKSESIQFARA